MVKYRVFINRDLCIDCGAQTGRCPTHAIMLAKILADDRLKKSRNGSEVTIPEDLYQSVKKSSEACPLKAIIIEKMHGKR
jgi:ferredoxin